MLLGSAHPHPPFVSLCSSVCCTSAHPSHRPTLDPNTPTPKAYPLDLVRTRLAAQTGRGRGYYSGIGGTLRRIVTEEGASGLYRGLGATLVQVGSARLHTCGRGPMGGVLRGACRGDQRAFLHESSAAAGYTPWIVRDGMGGGDRQA
jgi:hypothetical protein